MRWLFLGAALFASACGSSSSSGGAPSLVGNWIYVSPDGTQGLGIDVGNDGTYTLVTLRLTSASSADAEVERGTYVASGSTLTATPQQWTCPGPDPVATLTYSFQGSNLVLSNAAGTTELQPNHASAMTAFVLTYGCFTNGAFSASPLAPVSN